MIGAAGRFGRQFLGAAMETRLAKNMVPGPLSLFKGEQATKLGSFIQNQGVMHTAKQYAMGANFVTDGGAISFGEVNRARALTRQIAIGGAAAFSMAAASGYNPFGLTSGAAGVARLGAHAFVGATMVSMGGPAKVAGVAYLGATGINAFRSGNSFGPL